MSSATNTSVLSMPAAHARLARIVLPALAGSLFMAIAAQISIPVPFSPVPITGQTLAVLLMGTVLGARAGGLAMLCYLGEGAAGLPVFAGGTGGLIVFAGPTAGYLVAFPLAAFVAGALVDRLGGRYAVVPTLLALLCADALVFVGGVVWLAVYFHVGLPRAAELGLWPYVPGDLAKIVLVALAFPSGRSLMNLTGWNLVRRGQI